MVQAAYFILFFAIGIISVRISYSDRILTFNYSNGIRGIFSILIVMGHVFSTFNERNLIVKGLEGLSGPMTVGVFFMLSGYGLQWSRKHRCGYMHEFLRKRLSTLLYPFVFYVVIFFIFRIITNRHIENPIKDIFMGNYVPASWFVIELVFLYLLFYVIYSHKSSRLKSVLLSGVGVLLLIILMKVSGFSNYYFLSTANFGLGIALGEYGEEISIYLSNSNRLRLYILVTFFLSVMLSVLTWIAFYGGFHFLKGMPVTFSIVSTLVFSMLVVFISLVFVCKNNSVASILGKYSYDIYLSQGICLLYFRDIIKNDTLNMAITLLLTVSLGGIFFQIRQRLQSGYYFVRKLLSP